MRHNHNADLWQNFLDEEETEAEKNRPVTDGSQWIGPYDRRTKPRDEELDPNAENSRNINQTNSNTDRTDPTR